MKCEECPYYKEHQYNFKKLMKEYDEVIKLNEEFKNGKDLFKTGKLRKN